MLVAPPMPDCFSKGGVHVAEAILPIDTIPCSCSRRATDLWHATPCKPDAALWSPFVILASARMTMIGASCDRRSLIIGHGTACPPARLHEQNLPGCRWHAAD